MNLKVEAHKLMIDLMKIYKETRVQNLIMELNQLTSTNPPKHILKRADEIMGSARDTLFKYGASGS